jgi:hypothetical protein
MKRPWELDLCEVVYSLSYTLLSSVSTWRNVQWLRALYPFSFSMCWGKNKNKFEIPSLPHVYPFRTALWWKRIRSPFNLIVYFVPLTLQ